LKLNNQGTPARAPGFGTSKFKTGPRISDFNLHHLKPHGKVKSQAYPLQSFRNPVLVISKVFLLGDLG
jgi:hypothetical protein